MGRTLPGVKSCEPHLELCNPSIDRPILRASPFRLLAPREKERGLQRNTLAASRHSRSRTTPDVIAAGVWDPNSSSRLRDHPPSSHSRGRGEDGRPPSVGLRSRLLRTNSPSLASSIFSALVPSSPGHGEQGMASSSSSPPWGGAPPFRRPRRPRLLLRVVRRSGGV
ncbi:hypothetical protein THAOC_15128 [Thalassiosira oceanica]|uniref:Uncharacterized protein n=1 Tax=Thalassiosira oceanica TaxID=159749 RepID=K0SGR1_THAOC|nr:hypothetical protein THAOC_15128 [Thalassiosira oceanica]|eukprot:EJK64164.1 hypothetical protein THAOC_15128 [Thalassiosira oceanica]